MQICVDGVEDETPIPSQASTALRATAAAATSLSPSSEDDTAFVVVKEPRCERPINNNNNHMMRPISFSVDNILAPGRDGGFSRTYSSCSDVGFNGTKSEWEVAPKGQKSVEKFGQSDLKFHI